MQADRIFPAHFLLKPTQDGSTGERSVGVHRGLQRRIRPQLVVVVQVFVSQRQRLHPLSDQGQKRMLATGLAERVGERTCDLFGQSQFPAGLAQQHRATIGGNGASGKRDLHQAAFAWCIEK